MRTTIAVLAVACFCSVFSQNVNGDKLNIAVYFESLCPDSFKFIKEQLYPNFRDIAPYVDLNLVPFGKSSSLENGTSFSCHHGPQECKGNKILSCALSKLPDQASQVEFTSCFMDIYRVERNNEEEFGQKCTQLLNLNHGSILDCYNSQEGVNYQLNAEQQTIQIAPKFVPTIIFNKVFDQNLQNSSIKDFKGVVCELLKTAHLDICQEPLPIIPL